MKKRNLLFIFLLTAFILFGCKQNLEDVSISDNSIFETSEEVTEIDSSSSNDVEEEVEEKIELSEEEIIKMLNSNYGDLYDQIWTEYSRDAWNDAGKVAFCYCPDKDKVQAYESLIENLESYIAFLEENPLEIAIRDNEYNHMDNYVQCENHMEYNGYWFYTSKLNNIYGTPDDGYDYKFPCLNVAYVCLADYYLKINDLDSCYAVREKYANYLGNEDILTDNYVDINEQENWEGIPEKYEATYDKYGRLINVVYYKDNVLTYEKSYQYDGNKLIEYYQTDDEYNLGEFTETYTYDEDGRLIHWERDDTDGDRYDDTDAYDYEYDGDKIYRHRQETVIHSSHNEYVGQVSEYGTVIEWTEN